MSTPRCIRPRPETFRRVGTGFAVHAEGDVLLEFLDEAFADLAAGDELAVASGEGRIVDAEGHGHGGLVDADGRHRTGVLDVGDGRADLDVVEADDGADVAGGDFLGLDAAEGFEDFDFEDALLMLLTGAGDHHDRHARGDLTGGHATDGDTTDVVGVKHGGHHDLERIGESFGADLKPAAAPREEPSA